jgi:hypothetical protein
MFVFYVIQPVISFLTQPTFTAFAVLDTTLMEHHAIHVTPLMLHVAIVPVQVYVWPVMQISHLLEVNVNVSLNIFK